MKMDPGAQHRYLVGRSRRHESCGRKYSLALGLLAEVRTERNQEVHQSFKCRMEHTSIAQTREPATVVVAAINKELHYAVGWAAVLRM